MKAWDQQPGESAKAHEAARTYFELGAERTLDAVRQKLGKSKALMERWSVRWEWVKRAKAFDAYNLKVERAAQERVRAKEAEKWEKRRLEQREADWQAGQALRDKAEQMLKFPLAQVEKKETTADGKTTVVNIVKPARWMFRDAALMQKEAANLARLAAEMETEITRVVEDPEQVEILKQAVEATIERIMAKYQLPRERAVEIALEEVPEAKEWLN